MTEYQFFSFKLDKQEERNKVDEGERDRKLQYKDKGTNMAGWHLFLSGAV